MKEFVEKLIGRLRERLKFYENRFEELSGTERDTEDWGSIKSYKDTIEIVNQLAEEYKEKYITVPKDDFTEHLINMGYNKGLKDTNNNGWIPCSERLPQESEPVCTLCEVVNVMLKDGIVTSGWCNRYLEKWYVLDHYHDYPLPYEYKDVIAWQPLPQPYKPHQEAEWKDNVMKHFTKTE